MSNESLGAVYGMHYVVDRAMNAGGARGGNLTVVVGTLVGNSGKVIMVLNIVNLRRSTSRKNQWARPNQLTRRLYVWRL